MLQQGKQEKAISFYPVAIAVKGNVLVYGRVPSLEEEGQQRWETLASAKSRGIDWFSDLTWRLDSPKVFKLVTLVQYSVDFAFLRLFDLLPIA